jgi:iron complex outermembrane receptor protein
MISFTHSDRTNPSSILWPLRAVFVGALGFLTIYWTSARADDGPSPGKGVAANEAALTEIVVTAEKRQSTVQNTPLSITAISGETLQAQGISNLSGVIEEVPGISVRTAGPGQTQLQMRGLASSGGESPTVGFYLDETPLTPPTGALNGKVVIDPDLYDLNRVEVLRGPQGTLYGASSMGGTIKLITNQADPKAFAASAETIFSDTDGGGFNYGINAMVNLPISDVAALRIVGVYKNISGWIDRIVLDPFPLETNGGNTRGSVLAAPIAADYHDVNTEALTGARISALFQPSERFTVTPSFMYQTISQGGPNTFDNPPGTYAHYESSNVAEPITDDFRVGSLVLKYDFDGAQLTSATSRYEREEAQTQEAAEAIQYAFGLDFFVPYTYLTEWDKTSQTAEELRLTSVGDSTFNWIVGGFYSDFDSTLNQSSFVPGLIPIAGSSDLFGTHQPNRVKQYALFGEAYYLVTDRLKATVGLRWYSYRSNLNIEEDGIAGPTGGPTPYYANASASDTGLNPKFNLSYSFSNDLLVYGTAAKGFRPGGGNQAVPTSGPISCAASLAAIGKTSAPLTFDPDSIWNYEIGEKAQFLDRRVTVNADVFYISWSNVQQEVPLACGFPFTDNAAAAASYGSELEIHALMGTGWEISQSVAYTHAALTKNSPETGLPKGALLENVPDWTSSTALTYSIPVAGNMWTTRIENSYVGPSIDTTFTRNQLPSRDLIRFRTGLSRGPWSGYLFVNNVANRQTEISNTNALTLNIPTFNRVATDQPRTIGLDFSYAW